MSITFKDLENFLTVAKSKTLSEASEKLDMAQPSLSIGIKKLEMELGMPLFIRSRNGIKLTPQGKMIYPKAEEALKYLYQMKGAPTKIHFKIGCHPSVGIFILGDFFKLMHKQFPNIKCEIINGTSNEINKRVATGEIDFGILMNPLPIAGLVTRIIGGDLVSVWESKNRYDNQIIFNPEMIQSSSILTRWRDAPQNKIEVPNLELISHLVESGAGMGILPGQVVKAQGFSFKIVPGAPNYKDKLALVCFPEMLKSQEGKFIFEMLKKSYKE